VQRTKVIFILVIHIRPISDQDIGNIGADREAQRCPGLFIDVFGGDTAIQEDTGSETEAVMGAYMQWGAISGGSGCDVGALVDKKDGAVLLLVYESHMQGAVTVGEGGFDICAGV
jgi:hypothetical protein